MTNSVKLNASVRRNAVTENISAMAVDRAHRVNRDTITKVVMKSEQADSNLFRVHK